MTGTRRRVLPWVGMAAAATVTLVVGVVVIRQAPVAALQSTDDTASSEPLPNPVAGVRVIMSAGDQSFVRTLPALAFGLSGDQSLDSRVAPGPFHADFEVTFHPGSVRRATVGAELQGGSLMILRRDEVLLADHAGAEPRLVMTPEPLFLPGRLQTLTYRFRADEGPMTRLRGLWQPEDSQVPLALPSAGAGWMEDEALRGFVLAQELNCAACHRSDDPQLQGQLHVSPAPILGDAGARLRPSWVRRWLKDPSAVKAGVAMPRLFRGGADDEQVIEDLVHFLASMGGPIEPQPQPPDQDLATTGMLLYHRVGCVACHGPLDALENTPGGSRESLVFDYTPLGELDAKTTPAQLASFLVDPVQVRPSGRMPSLNLTPLEAEALAAYLMTREPADTPEEGGFVPHEQRIERGRDRFAASGCADCHTLGPSRTTVASALEAPSLEAVAGGDLTGGCLASAPPQGAPDFGLGPSQRQALVAYLQRLPQRRGRGGGSGGGGVEVPHDLLAASLDRLNCLACHQAHAEGGPEAVVRRYFTAAAEADLGDEGRLPPDLSNAGAKLNPLWFHQVLGAQGTARPYMKTRMPQFGQANVAGLPALFAAASGVAPGPDDGPEPTAGAASVGRHLVGPKGLNCIQCHTIAGHDSTGTPGPDLVGLPERLRYGYFNRWMYSPQQMRPQTRMPTFFYAGKSGLVEHFGGDAQQQIDAIWAYLSQGANLPLPDGLSDPGMLQLSVRDEPLVFRTFMEQTGVRAIACGFPEQIHCAFDADRCRLAVVWQGQFLNAKGAWAARGGSETNPQGVVWTAADEPIFVGSSATPAELRFRGYRLDEQRRPIFLYDLVRDGTTLAVAEQPLPKLERALRRHFTLSGPPGAAVTVRLAGQALVEPSEQSRELGDDLIEVRCDADGRAAFTLEIAW